MNVQCSQIQELMLYEFEVSHNTVEATENICCAKALVTVDHSTVNRWLKKFFFGYKNPNDQVRSCKPIFWGRAPGHKGKSDKKHQESIK